MKIRFLLMIGLVDVSAFASSASTPSPAAVVCKTSNRDGVVLEVVRPTSGDSSFTLHSGSASFAGHLPDSDGRPVVYASSRDPRSHFIGTVQRDHAGALSVRGAMTVNGTRTLVRMSCL